MTDQTNAPKSRAASGPARTPTPVEAAIAAYAAIRKALKDPDPKWIIP